VNWDGCCEQCRENQRFKAHRFIERAANHVGNDCLEWPYAKDAKGYGKVGIDFEGVFYRFAHRLVCAKLNGAPESEKIDTAHSCGNPSCVNPRHLRWATPSENNQDKLRHGTYGQKLGNSDVQEIRRLKATMSLEEIAEIKDVSPSHVSRIINRHSWANLK
jgi:hypothetical protein